MSTTPRTPWDAPLTEAPPPLDAAERDSIIAEVERVVTEHADFTSGRQDVERILNLSSIKDALAEMTDEGLVALRAFIERGVSRLPPDSPERYGIFNQLLHRAETEDGIMLHVDMRFSLALNPQVIYVTYACRAGQPLSHRLFRVGHASPFTICKHYYRGVHSDLLPAGETPHDETIYGIIFVIDVVPPGEHVEAIEMIATMCLTHKIEEYTSMPAYGDASSFPWRCPLCWKGAKTVAEMQEHMSLAHLGPVY
ncbi:hypothetical protein PTSG_07818 [Salpingoeca rosetta]|uniref:Uncharacterized protein n=1 Tax=Salpingoeca rosetta (strain ATCC 50818 / BSB-021) TaxID=946362 RepID=F2UGF1_SALR5|nr:uncharacterized protein PTSG_07818 [Salpingoeca rosetta]EGD75701.1 hypothetical protein PTSG_07818 [Salpingoeca rosetta]|eukprot:XP_004991622.1 hypothetical protein PTSG_07818 [Salpingoeca rosetta]